MRQVVDSLGGAFPYCASQQTKDQLYSAACSMFNAKNKLMVPFVNGAPGTGKTRMLLETLNMLKVISLKLVTLN